MRTLRTSLLIAALAAFGALTTGCMSRVSAGYVGLLSTTTGTGRGMQDVSVGPAWIAYNPITQSVLEYPTFTRTVSWTHSVTEGNPVNEEITFTTGDQLQVAADISLAYHIQADKAASFYLQFRSDDLDKFTMGFMRNVAREKFDGVAGRYHVDTIMGDNAKFLAEVKSELQAALTPIGVSLDQFGFIGAPRPPQGVIDSINAKVKATQLAIQKQNELVQAQADAAKEVATAEGHAKSILAQAQGQAEANRKLAESLSMMLIENKKLDKWDGVLPQVSTGGSGGIIVDLRKSSQ